MKPIFAIVILVTALIAVSTNSLKAQTPEQLYQNGLIKEEGEGALKDAINLFNQVADNPKADKSLQAKALLHVGLCYEKLGNQEAIKAYKKLVSDFPAQKNEVAIARERLNRLTPAESSKEITIRQVWAGKSVDALGSISADGEFLTYTNWETGNLAIRNLKTGENKPLTSEGTWKEPSQYAENSLLSPDGTQVAYIWYNSKGSYELRLLKIGTQTPAILYSCSQTEYVFPDLWFSDGKRIIIQLFDNQKKTWKLELMNVINKEVQILAEKVPLRSHLPDLSLSTDEKQIAIDLPNPSDNGNHEIYLLSIDSKAEVPIIKHPSNDRVIGWLPGRNELLFASDRSGTNDIWVVNTSNVESFNSPYRILTNIGVFNPMGFKKDGSLYYSTQSDFFESFILPLDQNTGKLSDSPRTTFSTSVFDVCWMSDGESLICRQYTKNWQFSLAIYNTRTGLVKTLNDRIVAYGSQRISPDEKSVLIFGFDKQRMEENDYGGGIYSINIKTGSFVEIMVFNRDNVFHSMHVEWDKEGKSIFYTSDNHIVKRNIETGEEKIFYTDMKMGFNPVIKRSSDGKQLLFDGIYDTIKLKEGEHNLLSIPEEGGEVRVLCNASFHGAAFYKRISLSPDGKYIYFSAKIPDIKLVLYRVPAAGGTPEIVWQSKNYNLAGISIHPDGKQIALSVATSPVEIRVVENLANEVTKVFSKDK